MQIDGIHLSLPSEFTQLRPHQVEAVQLIRHHLNHRKVVFLDAPTGAGKTLIGEVVRQAVTVDHRVRNSLYVCTTLTLQRQFLRDFTYSRLIMGRSNYPTRDDPAAFLEKGYRHLDAGHCTKRLFDVEADPVCEKCEFAEADLRLLEETTTKFRHCHYCHPIQECPYEVAKLNALKTPLVVANTAYFLTEANMVGRFGEKRDINGVPLGRHFQFAVIDEADTLEDVVRGQIELNLSKRTMRQINLDPPKKVSVVESWIEWANQAQEVVTARWEHLSAEIEQYVDDPPPTSLQAEYDQWSRHLYRINALVDGLALDPDNWTLDGYQEGGVVFKPVLVGSHAREVLWRHADRFLLMSATLISAQQMADDLGLQEHEWEVVRVASDFPVSRRPVIVRPAASVTHKTKDTAYPALVPAIVEILDAHPLDRILIHTVSYQLNQFLYDALFATRHRSRIFTYSQSSEREKVLEDYRRSEAAVLLAPSFERGVDLKDDDCRVIIVAKIPFPNLGDKMVQKRFYATATGRTWFATQTVRSLVQMTGRGMRHKDDAVTTYILDEQFKSNIWGQWRSRALIPQWWSDALVWEAPRRRENSA